MTRTRDLLNEIFSRVMMAAGVGERDVVPQELLQVQPRGLHDKPVQLHRARGEAILQAPPHSTHQGEGEPQPVGR